MHDVPPVKRLIKSRQQQSQKHNQQFWLLSFLYLKEYFCSPLKKIIGFLREHKGLHWFDQNENTSCGKKQIINTTKERNHKPSVKKKNHKEDLSEWQNMLKLIYHKDGTHTTLELKMIRLAAVLATSKTSENCSSASSFSTLSFEILKYAWAIWSSSLAVFHVVRGTSTNP